MTSQFNSIIQTASSTYGVPASLITAVIQYESNGDPTAVSSKGAVGLMQLMPATAASLGVTDSTDPTQNIMGGTSYLAQLINQYNGNIPQALAAYNAGPGNVNSGNIPSSTQTYVNNVLSAAGYSNVTTGNGTPLIDLTGDAAAQPTADILTQFENWTAQSGIDLTDPGTDLAIALGVGAVAYLALAS